MGKAWLSIQTIVTSFDRMKSCDLLDNGFRGCQALLQQAELVCVLL